MRSEPTKLTRARYYGSVGAVYLLTLLLASYLFYPTLFPAPTAQAIKQPPPVAVKAIPEVKVTAGQPVRLLIPDLNIDLPVELGIYNPATNSWSLNRDHAFYAEGTALANDQSGNTFIYGHRNKYVFLRLYRLQPGAEALVYTSNNHVFAYKFSLRSTVEPTDTSVLSYVGPPILTIQTCSGNWNEKRQMFTFTFDRVVQ